MVDINLLPWRDTLKFKKQKERILLIGSMVFLIIVIIFLFHKINFLTVHSQVKDDLFTKKILYQKHVMKLLHRLHFVGYIHQQNKTIGILKFPHGEIKQVQLGTLLPIDQARIISLNENEIGIELGDKHQLSLPLANG